MEFGKRLSRQLKKFLGFENLSDEFQKISEKVPIDDKAVIDSLGQKFERFLTDVEKTYSQMDERLDRAKINLEVSSQELMVANQNINSMLNSLGQGFLTFDKQGICSSTYSRSCEEIFGRSPAGAEIWEVLNLKSDELEQFRSWLNLAFEDRMEFSDIESLAPSLLNTNSGATVELAYRIIRDHLGQVSRIVLIATDKSSEVAAVNAAEQKTRYAERVVTIIANKENFLRFLSYVDNFVNDALSKDPFANENDFETLLRDIHTIKGSAGIFLLDDLQREVHEMESQLVSKHNRIAVKEFHSTVKGWMQELKILVEDLGQLIGQPMDFKIQKIQITRENAEDFYHKLQAAGMEKLAEEYYSQFLFEPVSNLVSHLPWLVKDLSKKLEKEVSGLKIEGGGIKVDSQRFAPLFESFVHLVRNSLDHGIESSEDRIMIGKEPHASMSMKFERDGEVMHIQFEDDGKGLNASNLKEKCQKKGIPIEENASHEDIYQMILHPGFSTNEGVSSVSGRGIGLSAVAEEVKALGGQLIVESEFGSFFRLKISVPLGSDSFADSNMYKHALAG